VRLPGVPTFPLQQVAPAVRLLQERTDFVVVEDHGVAVRPLVEEITELRRLNVVQQIPQVFPELRRHPRAGHDCSPLLPCRRSQGRDPTNFPQQPLFS
jgi:hypothetical protein